MKRMLALLMVALVTILGACSAENEEQNASEVQNEKENTDQNSEKQNEKENKKQNASKEQNVKVKLDFASETPESNKDEPLVITANDADGKRITDFDDIHVDKLHLVVVSRDLSVFQHLHPMLNENGEFMIDVQFPKGGDYQLISTLSPKKMKNANIVDRKWVKVKGDNPKAPAPVPDAELTKVFEGKEVTLDFDKLVAGKEVEMSYTVRDAESKDPITDLESYIGSMAHVVMMSEDSEHYIHVHPVDDTMTGPTLTFNPVFPEPGTYKIWGEIKHEGKVIVMTFVVDVPGPNE